jgi:hypothetical protein
MDRWPRTRGIGCTRSHLLSGRVARYCCPILNLNQPSSEVAALTPVLICKWVDSSSAKRWDAMYDIGHLSTANFALRLEPDC